MQSGRGRSGRPPRKTPASAAVAAASKPGADQAKRARTKLPPLPYGARVSSRPAAPVDSASEEVDGDDDDDDDDVWDESVAADAPAAAAVAASLLAEERAEAEDARDGIGKGLGVAEREARKVAAAKEAARRKRSLTAMVNKQIRDKHSAHVALLAAMQLRMDNAAGSPILQAYGLSLVPGDAVLEGDSSKKAMETLRRFVLWFRFAYQVERLVNGKAVRRKCGFEERVLDCVAKRRGDILDLVVLAAAALRATGRRCRIVIPMQPLSCKPPPKNATLKTKTGRTLVSAVAVADLTKLASLYAWLEVFVNGRWVHVDPTAGLVDAANEKEIGQLVNLLDAQHVTGVSTEAEAPARRGKKAKGKPPPAAPTLASRRKSGGGMTMADMRAQRQTRVAAPDKVSFAHVAAVENGILIDVTRRYVVTWNEAQKERATNGLFEKILDRCCRSYGQTTARGRREVIVVPDGGVATASRALPLQSDKAAVSAAGRRVQDLESSDVLPEGTFTGHAADKDVDMAATSEQLEFDRRALKEEVPTTIGRLRNHPTYVIERHLRKYEVIYPRDPIVGSVGPETEPVFLRSHVRVLHTRDIWYRKMREVKKDAVAIKQVVSKSKRNADGVMLITDSDLFGEWQTVPLVIKPVRNGMVSRGPRGGNVELWTPEHMPKGATHLPSAYSASAARKLGFDFVPAMTGFDVRSGRSFPRIEGIVIAEEFADVVRDAALAHSAVAKEEEQKELKEEAARNWSDLLTRIRSRLAVTMKYGTGENGVSGAGQGLNGTGERSGAAASDDRVAAVGVSGGSGGAGSKRNADDVIDLDDPGAEKNVKRRKTESSAAALDGHEHVYEGERHHDGDVWMKVCKICGMEVAFEKL